LPLTPGFWIDLLWYFEYHVVRILPQTSFVKDFSTDLLATRPQTSFVKDFSTDLLATRMLDSLAFLDPGLGLGK
jgi:hypothetical protein